MRTLFSEYLNGLKLLIDRLSSDEVFLHSVGSAEQSLKDVISNSKKILIAGNGGSAADSQHFAAEITGRFKRERKGYPAVALTTDTSALTAIANDYGFIRIFSRQVEALGQTGDVLVCISTSGNSENLIHAAVQAKKMGIKTIGLLGKDGGVLKEFVDIPVIVPCVTTSHIQEIHLIIYHYWCDSLEKIMQ